MTTRGSRAGGYRGYWEAINRDRIEGARSLLEMNPSLLPPGTHKCVVDKVERRRFSVNCGITFRAGRRSIQATYPLSSRIREGDSYYVHVTEQGDVDVRVTGDGLFLVPHADGVEEFRTSTEAYSWCRENKMQVRKYVVDYINLIRARDEESEALHNPPAS